MCQVRNEIYLEGEIELQCSKSNSIHTFVNLSRACIYATSEVLPLLKETPNPLPPALEMATCICFLRKLKLLHLTPYGWSREQWFEKRYQIAFKFFIFYGSMTPWRFLRDFTNSDYEQKDASSKFLSLNGWPRAGRKKTVCEWLDYSEISFIHRIDQTPANRRNLSKFFKIISLK